MEERQGWELRTHILDMGFLLQNSHLLSSSPIHLLKRTSSSDEYLVSLISTYKVCARMGEHEQAEHIILFIGVNLSQRFWLENRRAQCERKQYSAGTVSDYKLASHLISNSVRDFFEWMGGSWCCQQLSSVSEWGEGASTLPIVASAQHRFTQNNDIWFYLPLEALVSNNSWKHHESERWSHCQAKKTLNYWSAQMRICLWGEIWNVKVRNTEEKYENTKWGLGGGRSEYWVEDINAPLQQHWVNVGIWHWCQGNPRSGGTQ